MNAAVVELRFSGLLLQNSLTQTCRESVLCEKRVFLFFLVHFISVPGKGEFNFPPRGLAGERGFEQVIMSFHISGTQFEDTTNLLQWFIKQLTAMRSNLN